MKTKAYILVSAAIFMLVAGVHGARVVSQSPVQIGPLQIPMWASWFGFLFAGMLALWGFAAGLRYRRF